VRSSGWSRSADPQRRPARPGSEIPIRFGSGQGGPALVDDVEASQPRRVDKLSRVQNPSDSQENRISAPTPRTTSEVGEGRSDRSTADARRRSQTEFLNPTSVELFAPSEMTPITGQRCAESSRMLSSAVSSVGGRAAMPSWMSTGGGASTGTAARGGGSNGERVPRTGWRFVRHLNRLSALAFLQPVRKVSLGAEFPTPFRESILRPGLPTPLPRAGRAEKYQRAERRLRIPIRGARKERDFRSSASAKARAGPNSSLRFLGSSIWDPQGLTTCHLSIRKWSAAHQGCSSSFKLRVLGRLGWNSYGTEGAQRVAKVPAARSPKMA
jgi:hypothetical protein